MVVWVCCLSDQTKCTCDGCKDTRGSKMLDGEVRFGNDWADQVAQFSSWVNYCHGHIVRGGAYVWTCVCVVLCACLSEYASLRLYVCTNFHVKHTHTVSTKDSDTFFQKSAHQCSIYFLIHSAQHTNTYIFMSVYIYMFIYKCLYLHIYSCMCVCMYVSLCICGVSTSVSACACYSEGARLSTHVCASLLGERVSCHTHSIV